MPIKFFKGLRISDFKEFIKKLNLEAYVPDAEDLRKDDR
jgi:hypothetical protein